MECDAEVLLPEEQAAPTFSQHTVMGLGDSILSPTKRVVEFGIDELLVEAVYDDAELRRLVPRVDDMLADIRATSRSAEEDDRPAEDVPEWDESGDWESCNYAQAVRDQLVDAGCIVAELDDDETAVTFTGRDHVLKESVDFCVELAAELKAVFSVIKRPLSGSVRRT